ncbi:hypothetical protein ALC56_07812, partial [Trachymyrmex septentrionalis]
RDGREEEKKKKKILSEVLTYHTAAERIANVGVRVKPSEARYRGSNSRRLRRLSVSVCFCAVVSEPPQAMEASGVIAERLLGMRLVGMRFLVLVAACLIPTIKGAYY